MINIEDTRYSRLELINWWDQSILKHCKIMVVGCGALGNEIIKNLAMLGAGNIYVVDLDVVEKSNLTRSVLFKKSDLGKSKAETAAHNAKQINDEINIRYFNGSIFELGLNVFKQMDIVICGLDNREARLFVDRSCWKVNVPWIDGAIEILSGVARMFIPPDGVDYESTMSEIDFKLLNKRKSCILLGIEDIQEGKIPTTPTIASIIAGVQVQEAVKFLHKRDDLLILNGRGFVYNGSINDSYIVEYQVNEESVSRYSIENFVKVEKDFSSMRIEDFFKEEKMKFEAGNLYLLFNNELVYELEDTESGTVIEYFNNMNMMTTADVKKNGNVLKPAATNSVKHGSDIFSKLKEKTTTDLKLPKEDILIVSDGTNEAGIICKYYEIFTEV